VTKLFHPNLHLDIETFLITAAYIALGIYFYPQDPLFLDTKIPFLILLFIVITLYYGLQRGLLSLFLISIPLYIYYHDRFVTLILVHLFLVLVLGQFYHYWFTRYIKLQKEYSYTNSRLDELSHAFYTLKISHDSLEKSYALKPHSIRSAIKSLESLYFNNESHYENFLHIISQSFQAQGSILAIKKKRDFETVASLEEGKNLQLKDPLVQKALQTHEINYIKGDDIYESLYLIVIPIKDQKEDIVALLAIDKMPFLEFNQNNIISISILFSYFIDQVKLWEEIKFQGDSIVNDKTLFNNRYNTMKKLYENYNTNSSLVIFKSNNIIEHRQLIDVLESKLRVLDSMDVFKIEKTYIVKILVPFSSKESTKLMINKILNNHLLKNREIEHMIFNMDDEQLIKKYIKEKL
jgi:hypothetical protein